MMKHKYVLLSIRYEGDEPKMYGPDTDDFDDIMGIIRVETKLIKALDKAYWNANTEWVEAAFIQDGKEPRNLWKRWGWRHAVEVIQYFVWRMFTAIWKLLSYIQR